MSIVISGFGNNSKLITMGFGLRGTLKKILTVLSFKSLIKTILDA